MIQSVGCIPITIHFVVVVLIKQEKISVAAYSVTSSWRSHCVGSACLLELSLSSTSSSFSHFLGLWNAFFFTELQFLYGSTLNYGNGNYYGGFA